MRRAAQLLLLATLICWILSACAPGGAPSKPLRLGLNIWSGYAPFYIAEQQNLYTPSTITTSTFSSLYDSDRAFAQRRLDALGTTLFDALRLYDEGVRFKIVMVIDYSNGADGIVARQGIGSIRDLKGKRVSTEIGTINHFVLLQALQLEGLSERDVELVNLSVEEGAAAFAQGRIDAATLWDPFLSQQAGQNGASKLFTSAAIPGQIVDVLLVHEDVIDQQPDDVVNLILGWSKALQLWETRPGEVLGGMAQALQTPPESLQADLQGLVLVDLAENVQFFDPANQQGLQASYQSVAQFMVARQLLKGQTPTPDMVFASQFVREALGH